jgi:hypothetical protein
MKLKNGCAPAKFAIAVMHIARTRRMMKQRQQQPYVQLDERQPSPAHSLARSSPTALNLLLNRLLYYTLH